MKEALKKNGRLQIPFSPLAMFGYVLYVNSSLIIFLKAGNIEFYFNLSYS